MSITVKTDDSEEVHRHSRRIEFEGVEPILLKRNYSHGGKHFLPVAAYAAWAHGAAITQISVSGPVLKKDGTPGQTTTSLKFITPAHGWWGSGKDYSGMDAPAWLLELFGIELPDTTEDMGQ